MVLRSSLSILSLFLVSNIGWRNCFFGFLFCNDFAFSVLISFSSSSLQFISGMTVRLSDVRAGTYGIDCFFVADGKISKEPIWTAISNLVSHFQDKVSSSIFSSISKGSSGSSSSSLTGSHNLFFSLNAAQTFSWIDSLRLSISYRNTDLLDSIISLIIFNSQS